MTVEADPVLVETRLLGGRVGCPVVGCRGVLRPWGWARDVDEEAETGGGLDWSYATLGALGETGLGWGAA